MAKNTEFCAVTEIWVKGGSSAFDDTGKNVALTLAENSDVPTLPSWSDHKVTVPLATGPAKVKGLFSGSAMVSSHPEPCDSVVNGAFQPNAYVSDRRQWAQTQESRQTS